MLKIPARGRLITQEPHIIAPHLLGLPLAAFRRRLAAILIDSMLFGLVMGAIFLLLTYISFDRNNPTFFPRLKNLNSLTDEAEKSREKSQLTLEFLKLIDAQCPAALPTEMQTIVRDGNGDDLRQALGNRQLTIGFGSGATLLTDNDENLTLALGTDLMLGSASSILSWGAFFIGFFTVMLRLGQGRTLGKWLLRIRVIRLDGISLSWWDAFSRAGGYGASAATLFLGFLEPIWDPNRQAMHDRIVRTVVIRD